MRLLVLALALVILAPAHAAEARKYAILSLIGDGMLIAQWRPSTGARLDSNTKEFIPISEGIFDKAALLAANEEVKKADPGGPTPVLLFARERSLYEAQNRMLDAGGRSVDLLDHVRKLLATSGATHLILVTKLRSEARLAMDDGEVGTGVLEGVGFYIDDHMETRIRETGQSGRGLLAGFAYFRVALIDLAKGEVIVEERVVASKSRTVPNTSSASNAWEVLSGAEKVRLLQDLVVQEMRRVVPKLLRSAP